MPDPHLTIEDIDTTLRVLTLLRNLTPIEQQEMASAYRSVITEVHTIARDYYAKG